MSPAKMHADEADIDAPLVRRLLAAQFPHWADLAFEPVDSNGTVNAIYRLGDDMAVRLPRIEGGRRGRTARGALSAAARALAAPRHSRAARYGRAW